MALLTNSSRIQGGMNDNRQRIVADPFCTTIISQYNASAWNNAYGKTTSTRNGMATVETTTSKQRESKTFRPLLCCTEPTQPTPQSNQPTTSPVGSSRMGLQWTYDYIRLKSPLCDFVPLKLANYHEGPRWWKEGEWRGCSVCFARVVRASGKEVGHYYQLVSAQKDLARRGEVKNTDARVVACKSGGIQFCETSGLNGGE